MRFLVDAHLPRSLCAVLARQGHDAIHTLDLPTGNATKDWIINQVSLDDQRGPLLNLSKTWSMEQAILEEARRHK